MRGRTAFVGACLTAAVCWSAVAHADSAVSTVEGHAVLNVDGAPFAVRGLAWRAPASFGEDAAAFWLQPDAAIDAFFAREAPLLKRLGINTLRYDSPPPPAWVEKLYERYGLSSVLTLSSASAPERRSELVARYRASKGLLVWVVTGVSDAPSVARSVKKQDPAHAVGIFAPSFAALESKAMTFDGVDFVAMPSMAAAHDDAFAAAQPRLAKSVLVWSDPATSEASLGAFAPWPAPEAAPSPERTSAAGEPTSAEAKASDASSKTPLEGVTTAANPRETSPAPDAPSRATSKVEVVRDARGTKLRVDGRDFLVRGMNWGYTPIGENYAYDLWSKSDDFIKKALADEMPLLKKMGVNAIRQYDNIPPRWVTYIYETYGIYTMVNHLVGRYGFIVNGAYRGSTDYADPATRRALKESVAASVARYKDTPGVLLFLLGNENNYGLSWTSADAEDLPTADVDTARASHLYSLFGELIDLAHGIDAAHPVAIANGDVQYVDLIARYCKKLDIFGTNVYRGKSARDLFQVVRDKLGVPVMFTEFGADAYNAREEREDHLAQADYLKAQWREIYEQGYGHGRVGNAVGGFVFQWADGWWKYKQDTNLDVHDTTASWATGGYPHDFVEGANNMNEEWFGIVAIGKTDETGHFPVYPRASYYVLKDVFGLDPYAPATDDAAIAAHFSKIEPYDYDAEYTRLAGGERARLLDRVRLTDLSMKLETYTTGGKGLADPTLGARTRFDHLESFFVGAEVQPTSRFVAKASFNVVGNVPTNPLNEIFYEKRGNRQASAQGPSASTFDRVVPYRASFDWDEAAFNVQGYYRTGRYHWIADGDFFNLYREANYGVWLDTYNGQAPFGAVFTGKRALEGLRVAAGPQLYWGANPAVIAMYSREFGDVRVTAMHQEDIVEQGSTNTSARIPEPKSRKTTLSARWKSGRYQVEGGGIVAGTNRIGREFVGVRRGTGVTYAGSGYQFFQDQIRPIDTLGGKVRLTADWSPVKAFLQAGYKGLVADAGADEMPNLVGWTLREVGRGNHYHAVGGFLLQLSNFQVAPNVLYQRPLEGPLPTVPDLAGTASGTYYPAMRARNVRESPFAVLENRETLGAELVLAYDPTPATWMWLWDNERREDAPFATNLDFVYRHQRTSRDSSIGFTADGAPLIFGAAPPAADVWSVTSRSLFRFRDDARMKLLVYAGRAQGNAGGTPTLDRTILRGGGEVRYTRERLALEGGVKVNDWGPYDYHRDFNITFPLQLVTDVSYALKAAAWLVDFNSRFGLRGTMRLLDAYSVPVAAGPTDGVVWEVRSYMHVGL